MCHNLIYAYLSFAFIEKPKTEVALPAVQHPHTKFYGLYPILPRQTTRLLLDFWVQPPICKQNESFKADVVVLDQLGNKHRVKNTEFRYK